MCSRSVWLPCKVHLLFHVLNVQISSDSNANQLLDFFIHRVPILSFHEILPSMNEIFIRTITSQNNNS